MTLITMTFDILDNPNILNVGVRGFDQYCYFLKMFNFQEKVRQIKANTDYYNKKPANDWSNVFWHFFRNSWN